MTRGPYVCQPPSPDGGVALWMRANMAPRSNPPSPQRDVEYFSLVYAAAAAGHPEALLQVGRLALSARSFVECYYWLSLARARGMAGPETESLLADCREAWISAGCPTAENSVSRNFNMPSGPHVIFPILAGPLAHLAPSSAIPNVISNM